MVVYENWVSVMQQNSNRYLKLTGKNPILISSRIYIGTIGSVTTTRDEHICLSIIWVPAGRRRTMTVASQGISAGFCGS
jgi:hypothetical protein